MFWIRIQTKTVRVHPSRLSHTFIGGTVPLNEAIHASPYLVLTVGAEDLLTTMARQAFSRIYTVGWVRNFVNIFAEFRQYYCEISYLPVLIRSYIILHA
jgi:hypothetical protein